MVGNKFKLVFGCVWQIPGSMSASNLSISISSKSSNAQRHELSSQALMAALQVISLAGTSCCCIRRTALDVHSGVLKSQELLESPGRQHQAKSPDL